MVHRMLEGKMAKLLVKMILNCIKNTSLWKTESR
jgi:hypothetical protein